MKKTIAMPGSGRIPSQLLAQIIQALEQGGTPLTEIAAGMAVEEPLLRYWLDGATPMPPEALVYLADVCRMDRVPVLEALAGDYLWSLMRAYVTATILDGAGRAN